MLLLKKVCRYQAVGAAPDKIDSRKLYRKQGFKNFKTYHLKEEWGISLSHGYRLINAAKATEMSPVGARAATEYLHRKQQSESVRRRSPNSYDERHQLPAKAWATTENSQ
jgi:hypothetical protein